MKNPERVLRAARFGNSMLNWAAFFILGILAVFSFYNLWENHLQESQGLPENTIAYKPDGENYSFSALQRMNPDVIGWITIDNTYIDYPLLQGEDDLEYVNLNPLGDFSLTGSIFLSSTNHADLSDPYNLTYGHDINNGAMYGDLPEFLEKSRFQNRSGGTLYTPEKTWDLEIFAALEDDATNGILYNIYPYLNGEKPLKDVVLYVKEHAAQFENPVLEEQDQILAMSTCVDALSNKRIVVLARMHPVHDEEGKKVDKQWSTESKT